METDRAKLEEKLRALELRAMKGQQINSALRCGHSLRGMGYSAAAVGGMKASGGVKMKSIQKLHARIKKLKARLANMPKTASCTSGNAPVSRASQ